MVAAAICHDSLVLSIPMDWFFLAWRGRARQPIQDRLFHPIWILLCQRYPIAGKATMRRCWHRQLRFSKKRMLPASSASLIAPLWRHSHLRMIRQQRSLVVAVAICNLSPVLSLFSSHDHAVFALRWWRWLLILKLAGNELWLAIGLAFRQRWTGLATIEN